MPTSLVARAVSLIEKHKHPEGANLDWCCAAADVSRAYLRLIARARQSDWLVSAEVLRIGEASNDHPATEDENRVK